jgi:hypothetical protein
MSYQRNAGAVRRFGKAMKFASWLQVLPNKLTPPPFRLMQIGSAFWQSRALYAAARLGIADALGDAMLNADALAVRVDAQPDALARLMRFLAALGVFEETAPRTWRNNALSACLCRDDPRSVRAMILWHNAAAMSQPWVEQLEAGLRTGAVPFRLSHGTELFEYLDDHPDLDAQFAEAMDSVEALAGDSFATEVDWGRFARLVDVGGSRGSKALAILRHHPALTALVIDRPQVVEAARRHHAAQPVAGSERLAFAAGDLFAALPPAMRGDVYLLSAVLHGFDDARCVQALRNLASACRPADARIALLELVLPETGADLASASFDMQMFMGTAGRERTLAEWQALFAAGGVALEEVVGLRSFGSVLMLRPRAAGD